MRNNKSINVGTIYKVSGHLTESIKGIPIARVSKCKGNSMYLELYGVSEGTKAEKKSPSVCETRLGLYAAGWWTKEEINKCSNEGLLKIVSSTDGLVIRVNKIISVRGENPTQ